MKEKIKIQIKPPSKCSSEEIVNFFQLALKSGEVDEVGLKDRITQTELLGFGYINKKLAGIAALKNPTSNHKENIFLRTGLKKELFKE